LCKTAADVYEKAKAMLGQVLVTKQTGPDGRLVSKLLVAAAPNIQERTLPSPPARPRFFPPHHDGQH